MPLVLVCAALLRERRQRLLDVPGERVDVLAAHRLLDQRPHDRHVWAFGGRVYGRHHPAPLGRELPGDVELVVPVVGGEPERDQGKLLLVGPMISNLPMASSFSARTRALVCMFCMM
jgi:hypothetical protein